MMREILMYGSAAAPAGLSMSVIPSFGGELLVLVVVLALTIAFVAHVLFSPIEESTPVRERPRRRGTGLLRVRRPR